MAAPPVTGLTARVLATAGALSLDVELSVEPGEVLALVGPNGAGKTTLLRTLAGLHPLDDGHVVLDGTALDDLPPERRSVGVVFQRGNLFPQMSVLDNVAFGLRARGVPKALARLRAGEWLERVGLAERAGDRPTTLSGGEAQRVALARALAAEPRLLLLDEPLSALDVSARAAVRRDLKRHLAAFPGVRIVVTHDPLEALALADRVAVLEAGVLTQVAAPADLAARPRSPYVADLVGVNLLRGTSRGGEVTLAGGGVVTAAGAPEGDVLVVVHPRAVALHRSRPDGTPRNVWEAAVEVVDDEGTRARVRLGGAIPLVAEVTQAAVDDLALATGVTVWAAVKATEVSAFPA